MARVKYPARPVGLVIRALAFVGPAIEAAAVWQQLRWHAAHPDVEPFGSILLAHSGIYAGALLGLVGAAAWSRDPQWRAAALVVVATGLVRGAALVLDGMAHEAARDATFAHGVYRWGIYAGAAGVVVGVALLARRFARPSNAPTR